MGTKKHKNAFQKLWAKCRPLVMKVLRFLSGTSVPEIMFICSFIFGRYLINADFQYPREIILPVIGFTLIVTAIFYAYKKILRDKLAAHVASLLLAAGFINYAFLPGWLKGMGQKLLPGSLESELWNSILTAVIWAIACAGLGLACFLLVKHVSVARNLQPLKVLLFVITFIFATQVLKVASRIYNIREELAYKYPAPSLQRDAAAVTQKPDIYYLVFDRYGSHQTLQDIYNYDNSAIANVLTEQGFVTRDQAYANYPFTMQSISSTLAMRYHTDLESSFGAERYQGAFAYRDIFNNPPIAQILKQNGYTFNQVSSWWDFARVNIRSDTNPTKSFRLRVFGMDFYLSDLERDFINQSIASSWFKQGLSLGKFPVIKYDLAHNPRQNFFNQMNALKDIAAKPHRTPQFSFAHVLAPHDPYVFEADGSEPNYDSARTDNGLDERQKYTRQLTYVNTQIADLITHIRKHSPDAVIIFQPDEGPYPKEFRFALSPDHYYDPIDLAEPQMKQKLGITASYYMPGLDPQVVKDELNSSVNAFRFVLKHYLGYDIGMLPDCTFATGDKFVIYRFEDITERLKGTRPEGCDNPNTPL